MMNADDEKRITVLISNRHKHVFIWDGEDPEGMLDVLCNDENLMPCDVLMIAWSLGINVPDDRAAGMMLSDMLVRQLAARFTAWNCGPHEACD